MPLTAAMVEDADGLADLAPDWWDLWRRSPGATPFQSPAWLIPWWRCFAPGSLCALALRRAGRLIGLAPLYLERGPAGDRLLPVGIASSDYLDVLIDPAEAQAAGAGLVAEAGALDWQSWTLDELPPGAAALALPCPAAARETTARHSACPVLALEGDARLAGCVPARRRRQLRRAVAAAGRRGPLRIERIDEAPDAFLDDLFRLHAARWQERGEDGLLSDEAVRRFLSASVPLLLRAGMARLYRARIGDRAVGAYLGFLSGRRAYAYLGGFDPDFAAESPGSILMGHAIAEAIAEGASEFHFLRGQEAYKYSWGAADRWNSRRCFQRAA